MTFPRAKVVSLPLHNTPIFAISNQNGHRAITIKIDITMKNFAKLLSLLVLVFAASFVGAQDMAAKGDQMDSMHKMDKMSAKAAPTVVQLSQVEGEYTTTQLNLVPGDYIFEVTNTEVEKDLGFYLQDKAGDQVTNSGLAKLVGNGQTSRTGVVTLTEGNFQYSCPLNPTPHYTVNVGTPETIKLSQNEGIYNEGELELAAGYYVFEVTNTEVAKDLGFYLQDADGAQVTNSGLKELVGEGETNSSGLVYLAPGAYQYSCPLNPTPHYTVNVRAPKTIKLTQNEGIYNEGELELAAGYYVFEVTNTEVAKDLGFYLQGADGAQVTNSGLKELVGEGETNSSGLVYLAPGKYQYSCPLNPTPHYTVTVK